MAPGDAFHPQSNAFTAQSLSLAKPTKGTQEEKQTGLTKVKDLKPFQVSCTAFYQKETGHIVNRGCRAILRPDETETNVDTGHRVHNVRHQTFSVYRLSRDPQNIPLCEHKLFAAGFKDAKYLASTEGASKFPPAVTENKGVYISNKILHSRRSHGCHSNGKQLREEFFI